MNYELTHNDAGGECTVTLYVYIKTICDICFTMTFS